MLKNYKMSSTVMPSYFRLPNSEMLLVVSLSLSLADVI